MSASGLVLTVSKVPTPSTTTHPRSSATSDSLVLNHRFLPRASTVCSRWLDVPSSSCLLPTLLDVVAVCSGLRSHKDSACTTSASTSAWSHRRKVSQSLLQATSPSLPYTCSRSSSSSVGDPSAGFTCLRSQPQDFELSTSPSLLRLNGCKKTLHIDASGKQFY